MPDTPPDGRRIVSSRHLAEGEGWELSELEFGLIVAYNAFSRWMIRCMAAAGQADLSPLDILILHNVNHRGKDKRLTDICFLLNIEDTHTVNYGLRKLLKAGLLILRNAERRCSIAPRKPVRIFATPTVIFGANACWMVEWGRNCRARSCARWPAV